MITIDQSPPNFAFSSDYLFFRASSDNASEEGFRYVVRLRINGTDSVPYRTLKYHLSPNEHDECVVDISHYLRAYTSWTGKDTNGNMVFDGLWDTNYLKTPDGLTMVVRVDVGEYVSGIEQNYQTTTLELLAGYGQISDGMFPDRTKYDGFTAAPHIPSVADWSKVQTYGENSPAVIAVPYNQGLDDVQFITGGNLLTLQLTALNGLAEDFDVGVFPHFLAVIPIGKTLLQQVFTAESAGAVGDTLTILLRSGGVTKKELNIKYVCEPQKNQTATMIWTNELGGIDSMYFEGCTKTSQATEGKTILKALGGYNSPTLDLYSTSRSHETYQKTRKTTYAVYTVHADEESARKIASLQSSRNVWLCTQGSCYPVYQESAEAQVFFGTKSETQEVEIEFTLAQVERC